MSNLMVVAMDMFTKLFGNLLAFVYHCFDRIVIHGYLSALSRPEQVVHFVRKVVGVPVVSKEILSQRTADYQNWVEAYARNHHTPIEWAEKGVRKEDYVLPWLHRIANKNAYGVYFIFKSMEQGPTFRISMPKYPTKDPHYRNLARQRSRFTHYYFYIRDETLGPMVMRVASFFPFQTTYYLNGHSFIEQELGRAKVGFRKNDNAFLAVDDVAALQAAADRLSPGIIRKQLDYWTFVLGPKFSAKERERLNLSRFYAIAQIEYCRNFIFKRNFPIHKLFERSCELGLWRLTADKIAQFSAGALSAGCAARSPPSSIRSSMAIMSSALASRARYCGSTKSSRPSCATNCAPTISTTSVCAKDWTIWMRSARRFKPSPAVSPATRRSGPTSTSTSHCYSASRSPSPSARSDIRESKSMTCASSVCSRFFCTPALTSAVGPPSKSTRPSSPPSISPSELTV